MNNQRDYRLVDNRTGEVVFFIREGLLHELVPDELLTPAPPGSRCPEPRSSVRPQSLESKINPASADWFRTTNGGSPGSGRDA